MADYDTPINIHEYKYRKPVYYTNPYTVYKTNLVVKLSLTSENFNFSLANYNGSDFRLLSGINVLKMWKAYWSDNDQRATLFFKIPTIGGGASVTFYAYWGNSDAVDISDPGSLGFLFYDNFDSTPLSSSWTGDVSASVTTYGFLIGMNDYFQTNTNFLTDNNWIMEAGIFPYFDGGVITSSYRCIGFEFLGTENNFHIELMATAYLRHNARAAGQASTDTIYQTDGGLEDRSYQEVYIDYYEPDDRITVKLKHRKTYNDVTYQIWRAVEGDTRPQNIRVRGCQIGQYSGGYPVYINWIVFRRHEDAIVVNTDLDGSALYISYENVPHQNQDHRSFSEDFTGTQYEHVSSFGGDPYLLSSEGFDSDANVWISDDGAAVEVEGVKLTINVGWKEDITSRSYTHYDSAHEYYYNASKLSNNESDTMGRNSWRCTTTSGWAAIKFPSPTSIGAFSVCATNVDVSPAEYDDIKFNISSMTHEASSILNGVLTNVSDGNASTYWQTDVIFDQWITIDLGVSKSIWKVDIIGSSGYNDRLPRNFRIDGSLNNINWNTVYTGETVSITSRQSFIFNYTSEPYRYWRLYMFNNWGSHLIILSGFELFPVSSAVYDARPKEFSFYGSNFNPALYFNRATNLIDGTFENITGWQSRVFTSQVTFKYYILDIKNTYEDENIEIQEWKMMEGIEGSKKRQVSQLRIHPALYSNWAYNFPKEISLQGSSDSVNWTTLLPWMDTYTPFIQHYSSYGYWQRYSFPNTLSFWSFRLLCRGNWGASDNKIIIGEWSLHELEENEYTYKILDGTTNNIQQISASPERNLYGNLGRLFVANEKINVISNSQLSSSSNLPEHYEDFNIV